MTTLNQFFNKFKSNLEITEIQQTTISSRQKYIRDSVKNDFMINDSFLSGSYKRHTLISPLSQSDIDIFLVLDNIYSSSDSQYLLDQLKDSLKKTFPKTPRISRNGQAVTITFTDFIVDVVPSFENMWGDYYIPNVSNTWILTNPKKHVEIFSKANSNLDNKLIPLIKMIKCWNRNIGNFFNSFHLEVLAYEVFKQYNFKDYNTALEYFFKHGLPKLNQINYDPAGFGDDVGNYLNSTSKMADAESRFKTAISRSKKANDYNNNCYVENSVNEWKKIFGNKFPSYR